MSGIGDLAAEIDALTPSDQLRLAANIMAAVKVGEAAPQHLRTAYAIVDRVKVELGATLLALGTDPRGERVK